MQFNPQDILSIALALTGAAPNSLSVSGAAAGSQDPQTGTSGAEDIGKLIGVALKGDKEKGTGGLMDLFSKDYMSDLGGASDSGSSSSGGGMDMGSIMSMIGSFFGGS